jgi:hypothetical protein
MADEFRGLGTVSSPRHEARAYTAPRLIAYGALKTLTMAGSGHANEAECHPPGCNPDDPTKIRP